MVVISIFSFSTTTSAPAISWGIVLSQALHWAVRVSPHPKPPRAPRDALSITLRLRPGNRGSEKPQTSQPLWLKAGAHGLLRVRRALIPRRAWKQRPSLGFLCGPPNGWLFGAGIQSKGSKRRPSRLPGTLTEDFQCLRDAWLQKASALGPPSPHSAH